MDAPEYPPYQTDPNNPNRIRIRVSPEVHAAAARGIDERERIAIAEAAVLRLRGRR